MKVVLGINPAFDSSAAVAVDGKIVCAIAEERITREKHHAHRFSSSANNSLKLSGHSLSDVSLVVICRHGLEEALRDDSSRAFLAQLESRRIPLEIVESHHYLHVCCSFYQSSFLDAAVLVLDGLGTHARHLPEEYRQAAENQSIFSRTYLKSVHESMSIWYATNSRINILQARFSTHNTGSHKAEDISIGRLYSYASRAIFSNRFDAGKVMALAAFGKPIPQPWVKFTKGTATIRKEAILSLTVNVNKYSGEDLAASAQRAVEQVVLFRANRARELTGSSRLCISGGVFLNCVANHLLIRSNLFEDIFCPSAPSDDGIAIGAALHGSHKRLGLPLPSASTPYLGTLTDDTNVECAARALGFNVIALTEVERTAAACAALWEEGIVFWHIGRSEFGPRALGHRSVLGNPFMPGIKDRINMTIKHRETFRPVAPLVLATHASRYFGFPPSRLTDLMLESLPVAQEYKELLSECIHIDGSARVQTVSLKKSNPLSDLLCAFAELSGHPILINTSLNGENSPICESPEDTLKFFASVPVNSAFIGRYLVTKAGTSTRALIDA